MLRWSSAIDPVASRRARAERFGAVALDPSDGASRTQLLELTAGRGPDVALCSVSAEGAVRAAFETLRLDGRMVTVAGHPPAGGEVCKWVSGSWGCDERLWPEVLDQLLDRAVLARRLRHPHVPAEPDRGGV